MATGMGCTGWGWAVHAHRPALQLITHPAPICSQPQEAYFAALPPGTFQRGKNCGKCVKVRGLDRGAPGKWVTVSARRGCACPPISCPAAPSCACMPPLISTLNPTHHTTPLCTLPPQVMIVDECGSGCGANDIDFSSAAFKDVTGLVLDRKRVEWGWADCSS